MTHIAPLRAAPPIDMTVEAHTLADLDGCWAVIARQPLVLGGAASLRWVYLLPEHEQSLFRQGAFLRAISTVQGRDPNGVLCLAAKRGDNRKWWIERGFG